MNKIAHENFIDDFSKLLQSDREFVVSRVNFSNTDARFVVTIFKDGNSDQATIGTQSDDIEEAIENAVNLL